MAVPEIRGAKEREREIWIQLPELIAPLASFLPSRLNLIHPLSLVQNIVLKVTVITNQIVIKMNQNKMKGMLSTLQERSI